MISTRALDQRVRVVTTVAIVTISALLNAQLRAAGQSVYIDARPGSDSATSAAITRIIKERRQTLPHRPLPSLGTRPEDVANKHRIVAITQALKRARVHEENAAWSSCAKEAGDRLGDATELLSRLHRLDLLRELHLQIGACLSLGESPTDAMPHYRTAMLLDETPPPRGDHREEAEDRLARARQEVVNRKSAEIIIETSPPGATVWIDGQKLKGVSPLRATIRLGHHFVSVQRFRYEAQTEQALLQPGSKLKLVMSPARRDTLQHQLQIQAQGKTSVSRQERRLARAKWSGAAQLAMLKPAPMPARGWKLELFDTTTGASIKSGLIHEQAGNDALRPRVCQLLGEQCVAENGGIPWYIWPIAATAVTGAAIAIGFGIDRSRDTVLCPSGGCR